MYEFKTALVTGATSGIGLRLAERLLQQGWQVRTVGRSEMPKDGGLIDAAILSGQLRHWACDLANYSDLHLFISAYREQEQRLDVLFNNAGTMPEAMTMSEQGRELAFELNAVVPFILTMELKPLLLNSALNSVIQTSSNSILMLKDFDPNELEQPKSFAKLTGPYAHSKLALTLWTSAFAQDPANAGLRLLSVDPGPTKTPMSAGPGMPWWLMPIRPFIFRSPEKAVDLLQLGMEASGISDGSFLTKGQVKKIPFAEKAQETLRIVQGIHLKYRETFD